MQLVFFLFWLTLKQEELEETINQTKRPKFTQQVHLSTECNLKATEPVRTSLLCGAALDRPFLGVGTTGVGSPPTPSIVFPGSEKRFKNNTNTKKKRKMDFKHMEPRDKTRLRRHSNRYYNRDQRREKSKL